MNTRNILLLATALVVGLSAAPLRAAATVSPAIEKAIKDVNAADDAGRAKAVEALQAALGAQLRALLAQDDPEATVRLQSLLEYNDGLSRWAVATLKRPAEEREKILAWGAQPDVLPIMAKLYSGNQSRRLEAVRALGKRDDEPSLALLAVLLLDRDRIIYIAAMEEVWDKKPTDAIVDALWQRAIESGLNNIAPRAPQQGEPIRFKGNVVGNMAVDENIFRRSQDGNIATEVLIQLRAPQVPEKLAALLTRIDESKDANLRNAISAPHFEPGRNTRELLEAYKPREAVPLLVKLATGAQGQKNNSQLGANKFFWSSRTLPMATLLTITEQNAEDYGLKRQQIFNNIWTHESEQAEADAVRKLQDWWRENSKLYVRPQPATTTAPAK